MMNKKNTFFNHHPHYFIKNLILTDKLKNRPHLSIQIKFLSYDYYLLENIGFLLFISLNVKLQYHI